MFSTSSDEICAKIYYYLGEVEPQYYKLTYLRFQPFGSSTHASLIAKELGLNTTV